MDNRRGQVVVLRELFAFVMGTLIMITVVIMFNSIMLPELEDYSVNEQTYSVLFHVHSLLEKVNTLTHESSNTIVSLQQEMPDSINDNTYRIYTEANQLCIRTKGGQVFSHCVNMSVAASINGNFLSGTDIIINSSLVDSSVLIDFDNVLEYVIVCTTDNCDDSNPCTTDSCAGINCYHSVLDGDQTGCSGSTGCDGEACTCVIGECVNNP
ncbi:MAG: hypothetical protein WC307_05835 [Candidatus Nanoarchaeia archaeon]|jgi:hypothetical protein